MTITTVSHATALEDNNTTLSIQDTITEYNNIQQDKNINNPNSNIAKHTPTQVKQESDYIQINQDNSEEFSYDQIKDNSRIIINGTVNNLYIEVDKRNVTITGINDAKLFNSLIEVYDEGRIHLSNITFESDDENEQTITIILDSNDNKLENLQFISNRQQIREEEYREIAISSNNNNIRNSTFNITYPALNNNWIYYGESYRTAPIAIYGDYNIVEDNIINIHKSESIQYPYGSNTGICIYGNNNTINHNQIHINGTLYMYGITLFYHNNTLTNNYIEIYSIRYASGIAINGESSNNTIKNNTIILTTQDESEKLTGLTDAAYAIVITENAYAGSRYRITESKMQSNIIESNTLTGNSSHMYAIEQFGGQKTIIKDNYIDIYGKNPMAVALIGSDSQVTDNTINVHGLTNTTDTSLDYLKPQTTGIYLYQGTNTSISGNNITTSHGTAIRTRNEDLTLITGNEIKIINNTVAIDIINPYSTTTITENQIENMDNLIFNGENIIFNDNHDPTNVQIEDNTLEEYDQTSNNTTDTSHLQEENINQTVTNKTVIEDTVVNQTLIDNIENNTTIEDESNTTSDDIEVQSIDEVETPEINKTPTNDMNQTKSYHEIINNTSVLNDSIDESQTLDDSLILQIENINTIDQQDDINDLDSFESQILLTQASSSNMKVYELNNIGEKVFDNKVYIGLTIVLVLFVSLLYGYLKRE